MSASTVPGSPRRTTRVLRRSGVWMTSLLGGVATAALLVAGPTVIDDRPTGAPDAYDLTATDSVSMSRVASFNILGWSHTAPGGDRTGWASGEQRAEWVMKILGKHDLDVVGFQELQTQQLHVMRTIAQGAWRFYPADNSTNFAMHNSIGWKTEDWELVEANLLNIPYFRGVEVPMPYILLRHHETQRLVWVANFHNPADGSGRPSQERWRDEAMRRQIELANQLWESGIPLLLTGDMNEREEYFCGMTTKAPMRSASGGSWGNAACKPPGEVRIDWVFGSNYVQFSNYKVAQGRLIRETTDHPLIYADVDFPSRPRY